MGPSSQIHEMATRHHKATRGNQASTRWLQLKQKMCYIFALEHASENILVSVHIFNMREIQWHHFQ